MHAKLAFPCKCSFSTSWTIISIDHNGPSVSTQRSVNASAAAEQNHSTIPMYLPNGCPSKTKRQRRFSHTICNSRQFEMKRDRTQAPVLPISGTLQTTLPPVEYNLSGGSWCLYPTTTYPQCLYRTLLLIFSSSYFNFLLLFKLLLFLFYYIQIIHL